MNTKTRLALMFGVLLLAFGVSALGLRAWYARQAKQLMVDLQHERRGLLEQVLQLTTQSLRNYATDYSNWDEMLTFVQTDDPAWAKVNLDASLQTFNLQAVWVLRVDGSLVYGATRQLSETNRTPAWLTPQLLEKMQREKFLGFFVSIPEGLLEIRTAPIQPSSDIKRETTAQGWLLVGQLWNDVYLKTLGHTLTSEIHLREPGADLSRQPVPHGIHLHHDLVGWDGLTVRQLHLDYHPESLLLALENDRFELYFYCANFAGFILLTFVFVAHWVIKPLRQLEQSMTTQSTKPIAGLIDQPNEFGRLALLTSISFAYRASIEHEIADRKHAETALRQSEEQVRLSADLRSRLARDLHDNIIQSIYATGLGLETTLRSIRNDPLAAEASLEAVRLNLNQLIREIRSFISGLEPEGAGQPGQFAQTLQTLAATLQSLHPIRIALDLNPQAAARLSPQEEIHALQIVREGVSNALRHSGATKIALRLLDLAGVSVLQIEDNGCGFDPIAVVGTGSGLVNQASRAREMGAILRFDSAPGDGTRLTLTFNRPDHS